MRRNFPVSRRSLLVGIGGTGALLLTGCDRLSRAPAAREILASSERLTQRGQRMFLSETVMAREYGPEQISKVFRANGSSDASSLPAGYLEMLEAGFAGWRLRVDGLIFPRLRGHR